MRCTLWHDCGNSVANNTIAKFRVERVYGHVHHGNNAACKVTLNMEALVAATCYNQQLCMKTGFLAPIATGGCAHLVLQKLWGGIPPTFCPFCPRLP